MGLVLIVRGSTGHDIDDSIMNQITLIHEAIRALHPLPSLFLLHSGRPNVSPFPRTKIPLKDSPIWAGPFFGTFLQQLRTPDFSTGAKPFTFTARPGLASPIYSRHLFAVSSGMGSEWYSFPIALNFSETLRLLFGRPFYSHFMMNLICAMRLDARLTWPISSISPGDEPRTPFTLLLTNAMLWTRVD